jgi:hypothetical protein
MLTFSRLWSVQGSVFAQFSNLYLHVCKSYDIDLILFVFAQFSNLCLHVCKSYEIDFCSWSKQFHMKVIKSYYFHPFKKYWWCNIFVFWKKKMICKIIKLYILVKRFKYIYESLFVSFKYVSSWKLLIGPFSPIVFRLNSVGTSSFKDYVRILESEVYMLRTYRR